MLWCPISKNFEIHYIMDYKIVLFEASLCAWGLLSWIFRVHSSWKGSDKSRVEQARKKVRHWSGTKGYSTFLNWELPIQVPLLYLLNFLFQSQVNCPRNIKLDTGMALKRSHNTAFKWEPPKHLRLSDFLNFLHQLLLIIFWCVLLLLQLS